MYQHMPQLRCVTSYVTVEADSREIIVEVEDIQEDIVREGSDCHAW
jgi:hypothetical protein